MLNHTSRKAFFASMPSHMRIGAEIGVSHGDFSYNILTVMPAVKLHLVDTWELNDQLPDPISAYNHTMAKLSGFDQCRYSLIKSTSVNAAKLFADDYFDFIYIDADHSCDAVAEDLQAWYPKVRSGGLVIGHDYCQPWGVVQAVDEFAAKLNYKIFVIISLGYHDGDQDGGSPSWYFIKR